MKNVQNQIISANTQFLEKKEKKKSSSNNSIFKLNLNKKILLLDWD